MSGVDFVGAGPGDPELLTLAGLAAVRASSFVLAPASYQVSFEQLLVGKEVVSPFQLEHERLADWVEKRLARGRVCFLVPGDFSTFCPFQSFVARFRDRCRVIPGVSAHAAAAALLKRAFDLPGVAHAAILTSSRAHTAAGGVDLTHYARPGHTLILYMNDRPLPDLVKELRLGFGSDVPIAILEQISCPGERVTVGTLDTICERLGARDPFGIGSGGPEPALALVIAGNALESDEDPSWWNRRYERSWKPRGVR